MKKVTFVIGNGFDLNLGLKTSYKDFYESEVYDNNKSNFEDIENLLNESADANLWIDIEIILGKIGSKFEGVEIKNQYQNLCISLMEYLKKAQKEILNEQSESFKLIRKYLNNDLTFLDFNYTDKIDHIFDYPIIYKNKKYTDITHKKIHGSLENNEIIFGVDDSCKLLPKNIFLRKSSSNIFGNVDLNLDLEKADVIIYFGYSLGETDHMYFKHFFQFVKGKEIIFYYYDVKSKDLLDYQIEQLTNHNMARFKIENDVKFLEIAK